MERNKMQNSKETILLVDDHGLILQGIKRVVEKMEEISIVHTASSGLEAGKLIATGKYTIYMLDVELSDANCFDLIPQIRAKNADAHIIINTMHEEIWIINRLLKAGVNSIILKSSDTSEVRNAILHALARKPYFCPRFDSIYRKSKKASACGLHESDIPTPRELDVLYAIAQGDNTSQIAEKLTISENTVETFRKRLMQKFNARNAVDLVMKAVDKGFIPAKTNGDSKL